jgi:thiol:disulfide interchange protein DsbD
MIRKSISTLGLSLLFISLYIGMPITPWAQLSSLGLPQEKPETTEIVTVHDVLSVDKVQPGSMFLIGIVMKFAKGWHANANPSGGDYLIPTEAILPDITDVTFKEIVYPKGDLLKIASLGEDPVPVYHNEVTIGIQATLSETAQLGKKTLSFQLKYQACSDETCLLPKTITVDVPIEVVGLNESIQPINNEIFAGVNFGNLANRAITTSETGKLSQALSKGLFWAFLLVFGGGILTSLTPCVYPLIPITVSVFGAGESTNRFRSFLLSVTYVLGIALTYAILGMAVAQTGAVFGEIMADARVIIPVCAVLIALGLSMIGLYEIRLPHAVQNKLNRVGGVGFAGAFGMGTVAGIIAAPCTGPALGAVLAYIATTSDIFLGFWLMLTYALGMGLLFIVIGTFSGVILPRSGVWMYVLENIFGVAIITVALYFLKDVIEPLRTFLRHSWEFFAIAGVLVLLGVLLGNFRQRFKDLSRWVRFRKAFGILFAVIGLYMIIGGLTTVESDLDWVISEAKGIEIAQREGKPVMLDFYATWCAACNELDHKTYSNPTVQSKLSQFVNIKLDFTRNSDEVERLKKKYSIVGLPVVIFYDSKGNELHQKRIEKFVDSKEFLTLVEDIQ